MRLGIVLPPSGPLAGADAVAEIARRAEQLGYDTVWASDRELSPAGWTEAAAGEPGLDALDALAIAASVTTGVRLGINLVNIPFTSPLMLAERLHALAGIAGNRIEVGLGLGCSSEEMRRVLVALGAASPASEFVRAFEAVWPGQGAGFRGEYFDVTALPASVAAHPWPVPIALTAFAPPAVLPSVVLVGRASPVDCRSMNAGAMLDALEMASAAASGIGAWRDTHAWARLGTTTDYRGDSRELLHGSAHQVVSDLEALRAMGITTVSVDVTDAQGLHEMVVHLARVRELAAIAAGRQAAAFAAD